MSVNIRDAGISRVDARDKDHLLVFAPSRQLRVSMRRRIKLVPLRESLSPDAPRCLPPMSVGARRLTCRDVHDHDLVDGFEVRQFAPLQERYDDVHSSVLCFTVKGGRRVRCRQKIGRPRLGTSTTRRVQQFIEHHANLRCNDVVTPHRRPEERRYDRPDRRVPEARQDRTAGFVAQGYEVADDENSQESVTHCFHTFPSTVRLSPRDNVPWSETVLG
jgi:hypothetical protein